MTVLKSAVDRSGQAFMANATVTALQPLFDPSYHQRRFWGPECTHAVPS
jgi:hypothetical protein